MADFLLEIGTEEIPARMIDTAREELARRVADVLKRERLSENPQLEAFSTPRRLAVIARGIAAAQPDLEEQLTGPAVKVAFKDGEPTPAAHAFAKKAGVDVSKLERVTTAKGEYLSARALREGRPAADILREALPKEIAGLYWAKNMYWRGKAAERFVRPVRWMVALLDAAPVPLVFGGIQAGKNSRGHRVLDTTGLAMEKPDAYPASLEKAAVLVTNAAREGRIRKALDAATRNVPGVRWREDPALLSKVVNLTEFPSAILGDFDRGFLALPEEVLVTVMRDHQNYFAVEDAQGKLAPHFLAVLNIDGDPDGLIRHGHERVLRARFKDAQFFWDTDQKVPLTQRVEMLKSVTFQKDLGSYYAKMERMRTLAKAIVKQLASTGTKVDSSAVEQAVTLAKTDLTTELVKEFTELQGVIGGLYARAQKLPEPVATAIFQQYQPASMDDEVPSTTEAAVTAITDKLDSIAGMLSLGLVPTGSKDPFALRRQANGVVKIIAEHRLDLGTQGLFAAALDQYKDSPAASKFVPRAEVEASLAAFFRERLDFYLREGGKHRFAYDVVNAVLASGSDNSVDAMARAEAVTQVRGSDDFEAIATSFKRIKNILRQAREAGKNPASHVDANALQEPAEKDLAAAVEQTAPEVEQLRSGKQYAEALTTIARLRPQVDAFFDKVMVMVEDERLRSNRLALLDRLLRDFSTIADFSEIVTERKGATIS